MKTLASAVGALALLFGPPAHAGTTIGWQSLPAIEGGAPEAWESAYEMWGNGFVEVPVTFPVSGTYAFTLDAGPKPGDAGAPLTEIRIDQAPIASGSGYSQFVPTKRVYTWWADVSMGQHAIAISLMNQGAGSSRSLLVRSLTVSAVLARSAVSARTAVAAPSPRDPTIQPYRSSSVWNTSLGSGALWSAPNDPDTMDLRHAGGINAGRWSMPIFVPTARDPFATFKDTDRTYPIAPVTLNLPPDAAPAPPTSGGDHHMVVYSADHRHLFHFFGCAAVDGGFSCGQSQKDDVCGDGLGGYGWGAGVIRTSELRAGSIPHMLRYALPTKFTKAGDTWISGLAWPAMRSDYNGPAGLYTGHVLYGSTIGLPADVNIGALGLTPSGLVLARALQDYGALQRDTGGSDGVTFYAEQAAEGMPQLADMRADLPKIASLLAVLRNQTPRSFNGGGTRRRKVAGAVDPAICP